MQLLPYVTTDASGASGSIIGLAVIGGIILGDTVKWALKRAWGRKAMPRGRHGAG